MAERKKAKTAYSPKGTLRYPRLTKPDTKFDPDGVYSVKLVLSADDAEDLIETIDAGIEAAYEEALEEAGTPAKKKKVKKADAPYSEDEDDDGNPTGNIVVSFKLKALGKNSKTGETWKNVPKLYDAKGREITGAKKKALNIGSGTVGKIAFQMNLFHTAQIGAGVSLRLLAPQIIDLVEHGGGFEFGEEDGGFDADDIEDDGFAAETGDQEGADDDDAGTEDF